jgi:alkaline phosphatase
MFTHKQTLIKLMCIFVILTVILGLFPASAVKAKALAPKNVIVMISDGRGFNHLTAASYYREGKVNSQIYTRFPVRYAMSTYSYYCGYDPSLAWSEFDYVKTCFTDSAAAATAMATGYKTYDTAIGVDVNGNPVKNVLEAAEAKGKSTGVITTVPISHATPGGFVAHNVYRDDYGGIAREMINLSAADVIMGAGHPWYDDSGALTASPDYTYVSDAATWDALVAGTAGNDADGDGDFDPWTLVQTRAEFQALMQGPTPERIIGIAQVYSTLQLLRSGNLLADPYVVPLNQSVPTLAEMTKAALNILDNDPDGLFLMIEGGAIDWASHVHLSGRMIEEHIDFDLAVKAVVDWVQANSNWGETLLIVTSDHENGYVLGPGSDPTWEPVINNGAGNLPGMEWYHTNHVNTLVPFFAKGNAARWFRDYAILSDPVRGRYLDNTSIAKVIFSLLEGK